MTNRTFDSDEQPIRQFIDEHPFVRENGPIRQTPVYPLFINTTVIYITVPTDNPFCFRHKNNRIEVCVKIAQRLNTLKMIYSNQSQSLFNITSQQISTSFFFVQPIGGGPFDI